MRHPAFFALLLACASGCTGSSTCTNNCSDVVRDDARDANDTGPIDAGPHDVSLDEPSAPDVMLDVVPADDGVMDVAATDAVDVVVDASNDSSVCAAAETCNGVDDDCDGTIDEGTALCGANQTCAAGACVPLTFAWQHSFGTSMTSAHSVATDAAGNIYVAGESTDAADLGDGVMRAPGPFLISFDPSGTRRWIRAFGGGGYSFAVTMSPDGRVFVLTETRFYGSNAIDFGGGMRTHTGNTSCHVAEFLGDGTYVADHEVAWAFLASCRGLAVGADTIAVTRRDGIDPGRLMTFDRAFVSGWTRTSGDGGFVDVTISTSGAVTVGGYFDAPIDLGLGTITPMSRGAFVVSYSNTGSANWQHVIDSNESEEVDALFGDASGTLVLVQGDGTNPAPSRLVALDPSGSPRGEYGLGATFVYDVRAADGIIAIVGEPISPTDLGGGVRASSDTFLLTLDDHLAYRWDLSVPRLPQFLGVAPAATGWVLVGNGSSNSGYVSAISVR